MNTVAFTSLRTLWVLGLQKLLFPFIFRGNVSQLSVSSKEVVSEEITENIENVENCDRLNVNHLVLTLNLLIDTAVPI